jgi:hypothetical protein
MNARANLLYMFSLDGVPSINDFLINFELSFSVIHTVYFLSLELFLYQFPGTFIYFLFAPGMLIH